MTHFKVSGEALDVALRASFVKACELEGKPFNEDEYQGRKSKADNSARQQAKEMIRAAIEAALPAMFDLAGWQFRLTHGAGFTSWSWAGDTQEMEWRKSLYVADEAEDRIEFRALFATKESK